jgi:hypothetical protein
MDVLREVIEKPASRQVLFASVTFLKEMKAAGWIDWDAADAAAWQKAEEDLRRFNLRANEREGALTAKAARAANFASLPRDVREGLAVQLSFSFQQAEKQRLELIPLLRRIRLP